MLKNFFPNKILSLQNKTINILVLFLLIVLIVGILYSLFLSPPDYIQGNSDTIYAVSLTDGSDLGTFDSILRLFPVGYVTVGKDDTGTQEVSFDIADPTSCLLKEGTNTVNYTGDNSSSCGVIIEEGTLIVDSDDALGSGDLDLNGGTFAVSTTVSTDNEISVNSKFLPLPVVAVVFEVSK